MKKNAIMALTRALAVTLPFMAVIGGCGSAKAPAQADKPAAATEAVVAAAPAASSDPASSEAPADAASSDPVSTETPADAAVVTDNAKAGDGTITDDQALSAIKSYCYASMPDLKSMEEEYPVGWEIESSDENAIVVLFRSYTGALVRYYIDPVSGETYVTEFVSGITPEEERTEETLNVKDYLG